MKVIILFFTIIISGLCYATNLSTISELEFVIDEDILEEQKEDFISDFVATLSEAAEEEETEEEKEMEEFVEEEIDDSILQLPGVERTEDPHIFKYCPLFTNDIYFVDSNGKILRIEENE